MFKDEYEAMAWRIATEAGVSDSAVLKPAIARHFAAALREARAKTVDRDPSWCYICDRPKTDCACEVQP